jgi:hypothetical protein
MREREIKLLIEFVKFNVSFNKFVKIIDIFHEDLFYGLGIGCCEVWIFLIVGSKKVFQKLMGSVVWTAGSIYAK